jgi:hypothetical protein
LPFPVSWFFNFAGLFFQVFSEFGKKESGRISLQDIRDYLDAHPKKVCCLFRLVPCLKFLTLSSCLFNILAL